MSLDTSPPIHRGFRDALDRDLFRKSIPILAACVPTAKMGSVLRSEALRGSVLNLPKIRSVVSNPLDPDGGRLVLLRTADEAELTPVVRKFLGEHSDGLVPYSVDLDYSYWTADEILQSILPEELCEGSPVGFAVTGHIAHINLNAEYLPYKHIIGQIILDKNKNIKTVVNKLDSIDTQFRFFKMELIAGEPNYIVEHHESECRFTFDFTQVYWNSRLHTEHQRLVDVFSPSDLVADVFAGVGPFAVPSARKGCGVFANDLNPNSVLYLEKNIADNRVNDLARASCEDGRVFIRSVVARALDHPFPHVGPRKSRMQEREERKLKKQQAANSTLDTAKPNVPSSADTRRCITHFVMNLPDSAITFLDAFCGILSPENVGGRDMSLLYETMPMVHCHCFTRELELDKAEADIRQGRLISLSSSYYRLICLRFMQRVEEKLGRALTEEVSLHLVRSVAPNKDMYCISFSLPREVAFAS